MKAAQINKYGGKEVIEINGNAEVGEPSEGQVLVEVHAASVNPVDWKVRQGLFKPKDTKFPITLGGDFSGIVLKVGNGVADFKEGDEVYGHASVLAGGTGSYAEMLIGSAKGMAVKPKNVDFLEAAALPLVGISAVLALIEHMNLQSGQKILIHGAAGGIGSMAVQLAKHLGAYVIGTAGGGDISFVKDLGADDVLDYRTQMFEVVLKDLDAVFDTVGGETNQKSYQVLKRGGILVSMLEQPKPELEEKFGVKAIAQFSQVTRERLDKLRELVEQGAVKVAVDQVYSLDAAAEALDYLEHTHSRGKVVIKVR